MTVSMYMAAAGTAPTGFPKRTGSAVGNGAKRRTINTGHCTVALRPYLTGSPEYSKKRRCALRDVNRRNYR